MFYLFDTDTKEYLSSTQGQPSPREPGIFFAPASSTTVAPLPEGVNEKAVWIEELGIWEISVDYRTADRWSKSTKEKIVFTLGVDLTADMTPLEPQPGQEWNGSIWEIPLQDAKDAKYAEIYAHADLLIVNNEATFFTKGNKNPVRNKDRLIKKQFSRGNKKIASIALSPAEEAADDRYDSLMDWADSVYDEADLAEDTVETLPTVPQVEGYDVATSPAWPIWSPPV